MGFFSKIFGKDKQPSVLDKADDAYTKACMTKYTADLDEYFTRPCLARIAERIRRNQKAYMGLERYKHVSWTKVDETHYIKNVTYDDVQISKGISAAVGDSYREEWTLSEENGKLKVSSLRRIA